jgi:hypothetical protein
MRQLLLAILLFNSCTLFSEEKKGIKNSNYFSSLSMGIGIPTGDYGRQTIVSSLNNVTNVNSNLIPALSTLNAIYAKQGFSFCLSYGSFIQKKLDGRSLSVDHSILCRII